MKNFNIYSIAVGIVLTLHTFLSADDTEWTWLYHKTMSTQESEHNSDKQELLFLKENVQQFSQLVFSWNALRPEKGHFSFWVQARNSSKKTWGSWHKMMEWGSQVQCSYITSSDGSTKYVHVRLEAEVGTLCDAFRIKIKS